MRCNSTISSKRSRRTGLTLVEVLAALLIVGTLLVGLLVAKARHTRQAADAERRLEAVEAADALMRRWWQAPKQIPRQGIGPIGRGDRFVWRLRPLPATPATQQFQIDRVRLEIHTADAASGRDPLVTLDLVLPTPEGLRPAGAGHVQTEEDGT